MKIIIRKRQGVIYRYPDKRNTFGFKVNFDFSKGLEDRLKKARLFNEGASILTSC